MATLVFVIRTAYEADHPLTNGTRHAVAETLDANSNVLDWKALDVPEHPDDRVLLDDEGRTFSGPITEADDGGVKLEDGQVLYHPWDETILIAGGLRP